MEWREGGTVLASQTDAVAHECTCNAAAPPRRVHRDGSDPMRRHRFPAEELTARQEHVAADDLAVHVRQP